MPKDERRWTGGGGSGGGGVWVYRIGGVLAEQLFTGALTTDFKEHPKQWAPISKLRPVSHCMCFLR